MKGNAKLIGALNEQLSWELTAIHQYFVHAMMQENWGYERLAEKTRKESFSEMKHAEELIERILYLEGLPNLQQLEKVKIGKKVKEQFKLDLDQAALDTGLYVFAFHTKPPWGLADGERLSHLEELIQYAKGKGAWIARLDAVADWWLARERVGVTVTPVGDTRTILSITNGGPKVLPAQRLDFFPPRTVPPLRMAADRVHRFSFGLPHPAASADEAGGPRGEQSFVQVHDRVRLGLFDLRPGETRTLVVDH